MKIMSLIFFLFLSIFALKCTENKKYEKWQYLNQGLPGKTSEIFAPDIMRHLSHSSPTFTLNGNEMFWSTVRENKGTRKIYHISYEDGKWSQPMIASFSGNYHDDQPFISNDGNTLYFASKRPKIQGEAEEMSLWKLTKQKNGWSKPEPIKFGFWTPSLTLSGTLYFLGIINKNKDGIFRSELINGKYSTPELLPEQINKKDSQNWCPFIASDESYLIFASDRVGGFGSDDLYICFRGENGKWSNVVNMGETINTEKMERFPGVSPNGQLFFTRKFKSPNLHDLYWIDAEIINILRKQIIK